MHGKILFIVHEEEKIGLDTFNERGITMKKYEKM
jgi:hypothetical protein